MDIFKAILFCIFVAALASVSSYFLGDMLDCGYPLWLDCYVIVIVLALFFMWVRGREK